MHLSSINRRINFYWQNAINNCDKSFYQYHSTGPQWVNNMVLFLFLSFTKRTCVCVLFLLLSCMIDFGFFVGCSQQSQCLFSGTVPVVPVSTGNIVEQNSLYSHCNTCSSVDTRIHPSLSSPFFPPGGLTQGADVRAEVGHAAATVDLHTGGVREQLAGLLQKLNRVICARHSTWTVGCIDG